MNTGECNAQVNDLIEAHKSGSMPLPELQMKAASGQGVSFNQAVRDAAVVVLLS